MRLHVLRDGSVVELGASGRTWGVVAPHPLSVVGAPPAEGIERGSRILAWTGSFGESPWDSWKPEAWSALEATCLAWAESLAARGATLCLRPRAGDTLSDAQGGVTFLRRWEGHRDRPAIELALDPAAMLTPAMLASAADHLARMFEALAGHVAVSAVVLTNVDRAGDGLTPSPLHRGLVDASVLVGLARAHVPPGRVAILMDSEIERQIAALNAAAPVRPAHR